MKVDIEDEAVSFSLPVKVESSKQEKGMPYYSFTDTF